MVHVLLSRYDEVLGLLGLVPVFWLGILRTFFSVLGFLGPIFAYLLSLFSLDFSLSNIPGLGVVSRADLAFFRFLGGEWAADPPEIGFKASGAEYAPSSLSSRCSLGEVEAGLRGNMSVPDVGAPVGVPFDGRGDAAWKT